MVQYVFTLLKGLLRTENSSLRTRNLIYNPNGPQYKQGWRRWFGKVMNFNLSVHYKRSLIRWQRQRKLNQWQTAVSDEELGKDYWSSKKTSRTNTRKLNFSFKRLLQITQHSTENVKLWTYEQVRINNVQSNRTARTMTDDAIRQNTKTKNMYKI